MGPLSSLALWQLFFLSVVDGAPQKYRVEPNGQLAVSRDSPRGSQDASLDVSDTASLVESADRGLPLVRRDIPKRPEHVEEDVHEAANKSLVQQGSRGLLQCGWTAYAPEDPCPVECPLLAEESWNPCHFQCVAEEQCGVLDPKATIADYTQKRCRSCIIAGCDVCAVGGKDKCHRCSIGYYLDDKGECYSGGWYIWSVVKTIVGIVAIIIILWAIELMCRRPSNLKGLKHGERFRNRLRCHMPGDTPEKLGIIDPDDDGGMIYPMSTNLCVTPVGGAATTLHFSFQVYAIFWAAALATSWGYWAKTYGYDLLKLGTLPAHTPQQLCSVVRWGSKEQATMTEDKFWFICWAYVFQFVTSVGFAVFQQIRFKKLDDMTTLKDYACFVRGLPSKSGEEDVEGLFKDFLEKETGQKLVGVSVAWNLMKKDDYEEICEALELENEALEKAHTLLKNGGQEPEEEDEIILPKGGLTAAFSTIDKAFGFDGKEPEDKEPEVDVDRVRELLEGMKTSDVCFAVFETEAARDAAVDLAKFKKGFMYEKNVVRLEIKACEPGTVRWHGLSLGSRTRQRNTKMAIGCVFVIAALLLWSIAFYLPYAYYVTAFTYANGNEPSWIANQVFTLLVVIGNNVMYFVADSVTVWADFGFEDDREFWYNIYYLVACILNVLADMIVTGYLGYKEMVGIGVHTADGKLLESVTKVQDIVESYPMQKTLGRMLYAYCFPGTFLTPFIVEPIVTIGLPYIFGRLLLRTHRECQGRQAELSLVHFAPMTLGRYSDILLNMILAVMVLYLPGGYTLPMFMSMALSHIYMYYFDHWRVLRAVPDFCFSRNIVDQFGSTWMALPCALTASCAVFKGYKLYWPNLYGVSLVCVMFWAFLAHIFVHVWILRQVYKMKGTHKPAEAKYAETAKYHANTWFSMNPVHCLRSKYIWGHEPAQVYFMPGKPHLQRENVDIGSFFEDKEAQKPDPPKVKDEDKAQAKAKADPKAKAKADAKAAPKAKAGGVAP